MHRAAGLCGITAALFALVVPLIGATARPGYDHWSQYISELGEHGASHGAAVSLLGFLPTGVSVLGFIALAARCFPPTAIVRSALVAFSGVGFAYITAAFARCDPGCPEVGSPTQSIHNLLGLIEYVGALVGLVLLGWGFRRDPRWRSLSAVSLAAATVVLIGFLGMLVGAGNMRGLWQRVAEMAIFAWILVVSLQLSLDAPAQRGR